jgi:hypothetical protein
MVPKFIGWLPVELSWDTRPTVVGDALVRWIEVGSAPLAEPFLTDTVNQLRAQSPPPREIDTDIDTLLRVSARLPAVQPAGFIFHLSHCGSTLIANALKSCGRTVVVSESLVVSLLLRSRAQKLQPYLRERWESTRRALLTSLFTLFAHYRTGAPEPLVVKFVSLDIMNMELIRLCWPDVPCIVVIRDPVEVMVSSLRGGGWMTFKDHPEYASELFGWTNLQRPVSSMTDEEFCARVIGSYCASSLEVIDRSGGDKCMVVDYVDVSPDRMRKIAAFFGIPLTGDGKNVDSVFERYSKDPKKDRRFHDDREQKQELATVVIRSAANQWSMGPYSELRKRARQWRRS